MKKQTQDNFHALILTFSYFMTVHAEMYNVLIKYVTISVSFKPWYYKFPSASESWIFSCILIYL